MRHPRHRDRKARHDQVVLDALGLILETVHRMSIDTTKMLAAVAAERTENASLRALLIAHVGVETDLSKKLADALKNIPPAGGGDVQAQLDAANKTIADLTTAATQVQADLDTAAGDLAADNQATADAIAANQVGGNPNAVDPALPAVAQANQMPPNTDPIANQQKQPDGVPFAVANDASPQKAPPGNDSTAVDNSDLDTMSSDQLKATASNYGIATDSLTDAEIKARIVDYRKQSADSRAAQLTPA